MWCVCCSSWWHRQSVQERRQDEKFKFIRSKYIIKFDCYFIFMSNFFILFPAFVLFDYFSCFFVTFIRSRISSLKRHQEETQAKFSYPSIYDFGCWVCSWCDFTAAFFVFCAFCKSWKYDEKRRNFHAENLFLNAWILLCQGCIKRIPHQVLIKIQRKADNFHCVSVKLDSTMFKCTERFQTYKTWTHERVH